VAPGADADGGTRVILVRHGETEPSARGRCVGRLDVGLSDLGRAQAEALAQPLRALDPAAIYASSARRAIESAGPTASVCGLEVQQEADLCEVAFGALEGLTFEQVEARFPDVWREWMTSPATVCFPGGESLAHVQARANGVLAAIVSRHAGQTALVFTHGGPIRTLLGGALSLPDRDLFGLDVAHGSTVTLAWPAGAAHPIVLSPLPHRGRGSG
jgi:broad specificity phosphatase PhoE